MIFDTDLHSLDAINCRNSFKETRERPIIIEDDVLFIGTHCIIGKGVNISARRIIAVGNIVVKSTPSDDKWGGNPTKFIQKI